MDTPGTRRWLYVRIGFSIAAVVLIILGTYVIASLHNQQQINHRAVVAQCAMTNATRENQAQARVNLHDSKVLYKRNPNLLPGVTAAEWQRSFKQQQELIDARQRTINALRGALGNACDYPPTHAHSILDHAERSARPDRNDGH